MWLLELIGISFVAGTILGISWRVIEEWWERGEQERLDKATAKELAEADQTASTNKPE